MTKRKDRRQQTRRPIRAWQRFLSACGVLVALLGGVPALLVACAMATIGSPHPLPGVGSREEISAYLDRGLTGTEIVPMAVRVLLVLGWLLWSGLVASILAAVLDAGGGAPRWLPRLGLFGGVARWIAAGLTALSSLSPHFVSAGTLSTRLPFTIAAAAAAGHVESLPASRPVAAGHARVLPGESAETFAQRTLGDPERWSDVWALNAGQAVGPNGEVWAAPWRLPAGSELRLPPAAAAARAAGSTPLAEQARNAGSGDAAGGATGADTYLVRAGDSYWSIAEGRLGGGATGREVAAFTDALMAANAPKFGRTDPALLRPGDVVTIVAPPQLAATGAPVDAYEYVVVAGDSYWSIAEGRAVALHGADRAHATVVYDLMVELVALNSPRLGHADPELLHPGDVVWLFDPAQPPSAGVSPATVPEGAGSAAAVDAPLPPPSGAPEVLPPPPPTIAPPRPPASEREEVTATSGPLVVTSSSEPLLVGGDEPGSGAERRGPAPLPIGLGEAALLATGAVALLAARRRARLRAAEPPARIPLPSSRAAATERELRAVSDPERLLRVDIAVRAAAAALATTGVRIDVVRSGADGTVEVALSGPAHLPAPWQGSNTTWALPGAVAVDELAAAARTVGMPCVALVEIGVDDLGWDVLVDLEALGLLAVDAEPGLADDVVAAIGAGLAMSEFAEVAHVIAAGFEPERDAVLVGHRSGQHVSSVDDAVELAATLVGGAGESDESTFALRARRTGGEAWEPAVVLVAAGVAGELTPALVGAATGRRGVCLATAGPVPGARWVMRPAGDWWLLDPLGLRLRPVGLAPAELDELAELLSIEPLAAAPAAEETDQARRHDLLRVDEEQSVHALAADGVAPLAMADVLTVDRATDIAPAPDAAVPVGKPGHLPFAPPPGAAAGNGHGDGHVDGDGHLHPDGDGRADGNFHQVEATTAAKGDPAAAECLDDAALLVRLIGAVDVVDARAAAIGFDRSKTLELVTWLVTHRGRSTRSAARTALWELDVRDATFANVVSDARRAMARHVAPPDGDEWLRRTMTEELSLHEGVRADGDVVRERVAAAQERSAAEALDVLRPAVELVRGMPFSGTSYLWPDAEGIVSDLVLLATSATTAYARLALEAGDIDGVFWATGRGLNVINGHEASIGLRMRAHAVAGDLAGVRHEWEAYERVLTADPWSDGEPAPKLVTLRRQLLGK